MLHESQTNFKGELTRLQGGVAPGGGSGSSSKDASFAQPGVSFGGLQRGGTEKKLSNVVKSAATKAHFAESQAKSPTKSSPSGSASGGNHPSGSVLERAIGRH